MSVSDNGSQVLTKAAEEIIPGDNREYRLRTTSTGTFTQSGLSIEMLVTTLEITDTPTAVPATPLNERNAMSIQNLDTLETAMFGGTDVENTRAVGGKGGHEVGPEESWNLDIRPDVVLYGIAPAGKTIVVKVTELA